MHCKDGTTWDYGYNDRAEVTSGKKRLANGKLAAGLQFGYPYDGIGNRQWAKSGGDYSGHNQRNIQYTPNALNHFSSGFCGDFLLANVPRESSILIMKSMAELIEEVLHLPRTDRSYLASKLLESLDDDDEEISDEWKSELDRRLQDIDAGKVKMIPHADVMANVRTMLEKSRLERAAKAS